MNEPALQVNPLKSRSFWFVKSAWISVGVIIAWALLSYFVIKPQNVSLLHLVIWGQLMVVNLILFVAGFVTSVLNFYQNRKTVDLVLRRKLFRRVLWSLPGLFLAALLVFLLGFLVVSVAQSLFTVR
jgi:hypothetical protein